MIKNHITLCIDTQLVIPLNRMKNNEAVGSIKQKSRLKRLSNAPPLGLEPRTP